MIAPQPKPQITIGAEAREAKEQQLAAEQIRRDAEKAALADASGEADVLRSQVRGGSGEAGEGA